MSTRATGKAAARAKTTAMRAATARAERRRRVLFAGGAIAAVLLLVVGLVIAKAAGLGSGDGSSDAAGTTGSRGGIAGVVKAVTSVPAGTLDTVGVGTAQAAPTPIEASPLTDQGKPKLLYVGAEYCPFCAAERWPVVVALSRFGTWSNLRTTTSATEDVFPDTPTLSFHGARYSSNYLAFTGIETRTNELVDGEYAPLDSLSREDQKTFETYNRPPYTAGSAGSIPFLDIGNAFVTSGASFSPELLAGKTHRGIADALADPADPLAKAIGGSANLLTAALCDVTGGEPASVCTAPGVTAAAAALPKATR